MLKGGKEEYLNVSRRSKCLSFLFADGRERLMVIITGGDDDVKNAEGNLIR